MKTNYLIKFVILVLFSTVLFSSCKREYLHPKNTKTGILFKVSNGTNYQLDINIYDSRGNTIYTNKKGRVLDDYYVVDMKEEEGSVTYTIVMTSKTDPTQIWLKKDVRVLWERITEVILYPKDPTKK